MFLFLDVAPFVGIYSTLFDYFGGEDPVDYEVITLPSRNRVLTSAELPVDESLRTIRQSGHYPKNRVQKVSMQLKRAEKQHIFIRYADQAYMKNQAYKYEHLRTDPWELCEPGIRVQRFRAFSIPRDSCCVNCDPEHFLEEDRYGISDTMGLQERMKPADTSYSFDLAVLGNLSRGTNVAFKVAGLVNYDAILEKHSKEDADEFAKGKPSKAEQEAQVWKKDTTERSVGYLPPSPPDYEGQPVGRETGFFFAGAANVMPQTDVRGVQLAGLVNFADAMTGVQLAGLSNTAHVLHGVQIAAWCNEADEGAGVQIGLLNNGRQMKGLQIGLLNFLQPSEKEDGRFLPLVNAQF